MGLGQILEAARWAPTPHNMQNFEIIVVDDKKVLGKIAEAKFFVSETFIKENLEHLSFSEEELLRKKVGILGTHLPPAMRTPGMKLDEASMEERRLVIKRNIMSSSALLVVVYDPSRRAPASEGDFLGIMGLGCVMENIWLMAQSLGISLQIISSFTQYPATEKELKSILNIPENLKVAFTMRLGYPSTPPRPLKIRRDIEDFTLHNEFGNKYHG